MEITLIRHGRSKWRKNSWMGPKEFAEWIEAYDAHGICEDDEIPEITLQKVKEANVLITSTLPRSIHSADLLKPSCLTEMNDLFREVEMPVPFAKTNFIKLPTNLWLVFARLFWLCGYSPNVESYKNAKQRAKKAADVLSSYARTYGNVVVVGHGWLNRFIGKELQKRGWKSSRKDNAKHWQAVSYTFYNK